MNSNIFRKTILVPASVIDDRDHVNNLTYLQWCVDAAQSHWEQNASEEIRKSFVWYVLKHEIDYRSSAYEGEELEVETWVTSSEGVRSERCYKVLRKKDAKVLVEAKTLWCLLDAKTLRPTKITEEIRTLFM